MVKAELIYNPYIKRTVIKFNGHSPLIDSQVEKYDKLILQDWLDELPGIFRDEMNGYDFELEFSGPELEMQELCRAFEKQGISWEEVPVFWKNELENRKEKMDRIIKLMQWIYATPNEKFDIKNFSQKYGEIFDSSFSAVTVHGNAEETERLKALYVSLESVENTEELEKTVLTNTPILYCIKEDSVYTLQDELSYLKDRKDVTPEQMFFYVDDVFDKKNMVRILRDLGIKDPQTIDKADDPAILRYVEVYPLSEFIRNLLKSLKAYTCNAYEEVKRESANEAQKNTSIYKNLNKMENFLKKLKNSYTLFEQRDNLPKFNMAEKINNEIDSVAKDISSWKEKKIKITTEKEAEKMAKELNNKIHISYKTYLEKLGKETDAIISAIHNTYRAWYEETGLKDDRPFNLQDFNKISTPELENTENMLMAIRHEVYRDSKDIFLGGLFKNKKDEPKKMVLEKEWHYEEWRSVADKKVRPLLCSTAKEKKALVDNFYKNEAEVYMKRLKYIIEKKTEEKIHIASKLSDKERKLQADHDWFLELMDKISEIERS